MSSAGAEMVPESAAGAVVPTFSARTRLLVIAPHPDDETIATGLLIQQVRAAGGAVRIVLLTHGDNNPWPQRWLERRVWIGRKDRKRWGRRRHEELLQALACLDVPAQALQSLGWSDLGVTDRVLHARDASVAELAAAIDQFAPTLVTAPALTDRHPDHAAAHVLVRLALAVLTTPPRLQVYLVHGRVADGEQVAIEVPPTPGHAARKHAALAAHRSQMALSGKRLLRLIRRPEIHATVPLPKNRLPWQPPAWLRPWLQVRLVGPAGAHRWRWRDAPLRRDEQGGYRLDVPDQGVGGPMFVRLALNWRSPWIFDHWGWCELPAPSEADRDSLSRTQ